MTNWIEDQNPFKLAPPPTWWLRRLQDQDAALRVFPSQTNFCYIVARRSPNAKHFRFLTKVTRFDPTDNRSEAQRLLTHGCVFVKTLTTFDVQSENFFGWLRQCDAWNPTSRQAPSIDVAVDHTINAIEAAEDEADRRLDAAIADEAEMRASSGYTGMLLRRGNMTFVQNPHAQVTP